MKQKKKPHALPPALVLDREGAGRRAVEQDAHQEARRGLAAATEGLPVVLGALGDLVRAVGGQEVRVALQAQGAVCREAEGSAVCRASPR